MKQWKAGSNQDISVSALDHINKECKETSKNGRRFLLVFVSEGRLASRINDRVQVQVNNIKQPR